MDVKQALNKMTAYCAAAERCKDDVKKKLTRWEFGDEDINAILKYLESNNYIDEHRYAEAFIRDKSLFSKWGKKKIAMTLRLKGLDENVYHSLLEDLDKQEYLVQLKNLIENKKKSVKAKNEYELKGKLIRFALGRGYSMSEVLECLGMDDAYEL